MSATSGTLNQTQLTAIQLIELAARRAKLNPETLTGEHLETAALDLYLTVTQLAAVGLQLWIIERVALALEPGRGTYTALITGEVEELKEVVLRTPLGVTTSAGTPGSGVLTSALYTSAQLNGIGVAFDVIPNGTANLEAYDGAAWEVIATGVRLGQLTQWFPLEKILSSTRVRVTWTSGTAAPGHFLLATSVTDRPLEPMSRDEWAYQPRKLSDTGQPVLWYFERQIAPILNIYPTPTGVYDHAVVWWRRRMQDVGALSNLIEIPARWYDPLVTELSVRLGTDIPGADEARLAMNVSMANSRTALASGEETDSGAVRISPGLGAYTR